MTGPPLAAPPFEDGGLVRFEGTPESPHLARILELVRTERDPAFRLLRRDPIPFAPLARPLAEARVALVTTAGLHLRGAPAFTVLEQPFGDTSFRVLPNDAPREELDLDAPYLDRKFVTEDPEVALPRRALGRLHRRGLVGPPAARHASFCGGILRPFPGLRASAEALLAHFAEDGVDAAVLCPTCPTCVQTAGLVAGELEARGLPTVSLSLLPELSRITGVPRTLLLRFPFGAPCGDPHNGGLHEAVLTEALELLRDAAGPGTMRASGLAWRRGA